jgi:hypothetical protein
MNKFLRIALPWALSALMLPLAASAQVLPGKHPAYLHALTDLRTARALIEHQPGDRKVYADEDVAITEIDATINEIKHASIDDGKDLHDHPPVDVHEHGSRLLRAIETLKKARADMDQEEDNPEVRELHARAQGHIGRAIEATVRAHAAWLNEAKSTSMPPAEPGQVLPGKHPAYLHALTDLRTARALLERQPGDRAVYADEDVAITEIDATIGEIKRASIDDGKDLHDHPPVDVHEHGSRLLRAIETLKKARADMDQEEDNPEVRELHGRAQGHVGRAIEAAVRAHAAWLNDVKSKSPSNG